uniref:propane 2-monooxygenase n=1 Tax=uncultured Pseudonocardia sp. TaxID=211455 RepID=A0A4Y5QZU2_9PSEU|nr:beta-subunit of multicomponent tetrahydrofuran monooxygenase [uncultured Pseudonocardia sp.]
MSAAAERRELREAERTQHWFIPERKRSTLYEDVTIDVQPSVHRHTRFGYPIAFPDGRPSFWDDSTAIRSSDWYAFRDPGGLWERTFFQRGSTHEREIETCLNVARDNNLLTAMGKEWVDFLSAQLLPISLTEYGLVAPQSAAVRPALGDAIANCLGFSAGYKLRQAQALVLYGGELEQAIPGFSTTDGKRRFLEDPAWQPTRRYLERLASITDWAETVVAVNICFEPLVGSLLRREVLIRLAGSFGDAATPTVGQVAQAEWGWVRDWSAALVRFMLNDAAHADANSGQIADWLADWGAMARDAIDALEPVLTEVDPGYADTRERINQDHVGLLQECGLKPSEVAV